MSNKSVAAIVAIVALAVPATSVAGPPPGKGRGHEKHGVAAEQLSAAATETAAVAPAPETTEAPAETIERPVRGKAHAKRVKLHTFVFVGRFTAPDVVEVVGGNAFVRRGGFRGQQVTFDFASAKVAVADTDGDGVATLADVQDGDTVVVKARLPRRTRFVAAAEGETAEPVIARTLVDRTNPPVED